MFIASSQKVDLESNSFDKCYGKNAVFWSKQFQSHKPFRPKTIQERVRGVSRRLLWYVIRNSNHGLINNSSLCENRLGNSTQNRTDKSNSMPKTGNYVQVLLKVFIDFITIY